MCRSIWKLNDNLQADLFTQYIVNDKYSKNIAGCCDGAGNLDSRRAPEILGMHHIAVLAGLELAHSFAGRVYKLKHRVH
jgi:hypothetical protein